MVCPPVVALKLTVPANVLPDGIGVAEVFWVVMVPGLVTLESVPPKVNVTMFKVPPAVVVNVPFTVKSPAAV